MVSACHIQREQFYQTNALESYHRNDGGGDVGKIGTEWQERKQVFADIPSPPLPRPREINTLWTISELTTKQNSTPQTKTWMLRQSPFSYSPLWQRLRSTGSLVVHGCGHVSLSSVSREDGVSAEQGLRAPWPFSSQLTLSNTTLFWLPRRKNQCDEESQACFELHCKGRSPEAAVPGGSALPLRPFWRFATGNVVMKAWFPFELRLPGEGERLRKELSCWNLPGLLRWQRGERGSGHASSLCLLRMLRENQEEKKKGRFHGSLFSLALIRKGVNYDLIKRLKFLLVKD